MMLCTYSYTKVCWGACWECRRSLAYFLGVDDVFCHASVPSSVAFRLLWACKLTNDVFVVSLIIILCSLSAVYSAFDNVPLKSNFFCYTVCPVFTKRVFCCCSGHHHQQRRQTFCCDCGLSEWVIVIIIIRFNMCLIINHFLPLDPKVHSIVVALVAIILS